MDIEDGKRCTNCGGIISHAPDCFQWLGDDELEELIEDAKLELDRRRRFRGWHESDDSLRKGTAIQSESEG